MTSEEITARQQAVLNSKTFARIAQTYDTKNKRVLDMGCGFGEYMQRFGEHSVGLTTTPDEVRYGEAHNLDIRLGNVERMSEVLDPTTDQFDMFWGNNLFEHLLSPHAFLVNLKPFARPDALLILGVPVVPVVPALMRIRQFRGALASPHVNFFTLDTLKLTVQYAGWTVRDIRSFHLESRVLDHLTRRGAPHLYVVATNNQDYQYPPKKVHEWEDDPVCKELIKTMHGT